MAFEIVIWLLFLTFLAGLLIGYDIGVSRKAKTKEEIERETKKTYARRERK